ncbi:MAG: TetR/AcrR family transcriptional regulator [Actinomycetota bacterium]
MPAHTEWGHARRWHILRAAEEMLRYRGVKNTGFRDIAARAEMSPGHVQHYFRSKQDLLLDTLIAIDDRTSNASDRDGRNIAAPMDRLRRFIDDYLPEGPRDLRWQLLLEVARPINYEPTIRPLVLRDDARRRSLGALLLEASGQQPRPFDDGPLSPAAERILTTLDGLALRIVLRVTPTSRTHALIEARRAIARELERA